MNGKQKLIIEVLNGPLDGAMLALEQETEWSKAGQGPLSFPWDDELGSPQARFRPDTEGWQVQGHQAAHGTYRVNESQRITSSVPVEVGDILKASATWLLVRAIGVAGRP